MALPNRKDVASELTWDLTPLYPNDKAWAKDLTVLKQLVKDLAADFDGHLTTTAQILSGLTALEKVEQKASLIEHYAFLHQASDMTDPHFNHLLKQAEQTLAFKNAKLAFFDIQVSQNSTAILDEVATKEPRFASVIRHLKAKQKHLLEPKAEAALALLGPTLNAPEKIYTTTRAADMDFEDFVVDKTTYPMSFVLYENTYQYHPNYKVRQKAFESFSKTLKKYQDTVAATYYTQVAKEKTLATLRGFDSVFDYLLADQEVTHEMFDRQIDLILDKLGPVMQKYAKLIGKTHGLKQMNFADLQIDLDPEFAPKVSLNEAPNYIKKAVSLLGDNYAKMVMRSFDERWVDFAVNAGKETGGFETDPYGVHPYILMSWTDELADVYTLIHELGHAGQALLTAQNNSILGSDPSMYLIEAPSTFNELLLTHSLEQSTTDPRMQRFAYTKMLTNTFYHNFVTHLLEAAFQREVYQIIDAGGSFDGAKLCELKQKVLKRFWGDAVVIDERAALTWMRQSHYYMGLYSYTYSAGLTIATQAYLKLVADPKPQVAAWLEFLKLGDQKTPVDAAKVAGVDISTAAPLENTIAFLDETVEKIKALTNQLENN